MKRRCAVWAACHFALAACALLLAGCTLRLPPTPTPTQTPRPAAILPTPTPAETLAPQVSPAPLRAEDLPVAAPSVAIVPTIGRDRAAGTAAIVATPVAPAAVAASPEDPAAPPLVVVAPPAPAGAPTPAPTLAPIPPAAQPPADAQPADAQPTETASPDPEPVEMEPLESEPASSAATQANLPPSPLEGDLDAAYPLQFDTSRFLLHYTPGSVTAADPAATAAQVQTALEHLERLFGRTLPGGFDVYVAGSLFAPPDQALRGRSFSALRRLFFLQDGSGSPWDQLYIAGHELTHLYLWNATGAPSSVMLSEGAAVYAGSKLVAEQGPLPLQHICLAYARAGALPYIAGDLAYQGHIRDLENYYAAGCFVQYLVETYGVEAFAQLYPTSDYWGVYGKSLAALVDEWQVQLLALPDTLPFDPAAFVAAAERIKAGYRDLFAAYRSTPEDRARYAELDRARTDLLAGRVE